MENDNKFKFEYQLLDRCKQDCKYYLGNGNRQSKYLWGITVEGHIAKMRELYALLPEKPEWLSERDIDRYEEQMTRKFNPSEQEALVATFNQMLAPLPKQPDERLKFWTNGEDILCRTKEEAETIADLLDSMGYVASTGYFDPDEDERNEETDECTDYYYVTV
jgi:hypothetical protein